MPEYHNPQTGQAIKLNEQATALEEAGTRGPSHRIATLPRL